MTLGAPVRFALRALVVIQVVTAFAGIALLGRMEPAIGRIVVANERSISAAEDMLAVLANPDPVTRDRADFARALRLASHNITEPEEHGVLRRLRASSARALAGDAEATHAAIAELRALGRINREAMRRADEAARRLGLAGRWALTLLGLVGLGASALSMRRVRRRFLAPVAELARVADAHRGGDHHRRCQAFPDTELTLLISTFNTVLDRADRASAGPRERAQDQLRAALAYFIDRAGGRLVLMDEEGELVALSEAALALMATSGVEIRAELREGAEGGWVERVDRIGSTSLSAVALREAREA